MIENKPENQTDETKGEEKILSESSPAEGKAEWGGTAALPPKRSGKKKVIFFLIFFLICGASLAVTAVSDFSGDVLPLSEILATIGSNWFYLIIAVACCLLVLFFDWLKTVCLMYGFRRKTHWKMCAEVAVITKFYDYVTPFGAGGQPFAAYLMTKRGIDGGTSTAVVICAFLLQQFAFILLCILSMIFSFHLITPATKVLAFVGLAFYVVVPVTVVVFSVMPKATTKIVSGIIRLCGKIKLVRDPDKTIRKAMGVVSRNSKCLRSIGKHKGAFTLATLCAFAAQFSMFSVAYFTLKTFGYDLPDVNGFREWLDLSQIVCILYAAVAFIPTPGNAGASEISFYFIFANNLAGGSGFTAMLIWRVLSYYMYIIIGACLSFCTSRIESRRIHKMEREQAALAAAAPPEDPPKDPPEERERKEE